MSPSNDPQHEIRSLVEKARAGDATAFEELVRLHRGALARFLSPRLAGQGGGVELEEALQETFVRAFESLGRFRWQGEGSFEAWLRAIARNAQLKAARKKAPSPVLEIVRDLPATDTSPSKAMRREERFDRFEKAIGALSGDHKEVLMLARIEGLPIAEISRRMHRSPDAVKQLLSRALRALRRTFGNTESVRLPQHRHFTEERRTDGDS